MPHFLEPVKTDLNSFTTHARGCAASGDLQGRQRGNPDLTQLFVSQKKSVSELYQSSFFIFFVFSYL